MKKIVKLFDYHHIINIADMHKRLKFEKFYVFRNILHIFFSQFQFFFSMIWSAFYKHKIENSSALNQLFDQYDKTTNA